MKRCSTSLIITEIQIKTTMRYHFTLVRTAIIKNSTNNKSQRGCGKKRILLFCQWGCKLVWPLWKTVWGFHRKLKIKLLYNPAILVQGIYLDKAIIQKYTYMPMLTEVLSIIAKTWKQYKLPWREEWTKKMWYIYMIEY